ncbi:hypothetical protein H5410_017981 [Solanum commersonii]|uniref:Uncharacterized protein n=1 Tax=Solanum commersonii TaxID=4109 RepID=A0A9J6A0Q3_SOLCO|nr:hypothetical protein H5410_017981 [Solanum commersonii]
MSFLTGAPKNSWQLAMTVDTTTSNYWLNWRYEGPRGSRNRRREEEKDSPGLLYEDEVWKPCLKTIHPGWLLGYRVVAFLILLLLLIMNLGSVLSMYGCYQYHNKVGNERQDIEYSSRRLSMNVESSTSSNAAKQAMENTEQSSRQIADFWGYVFQIIFQWIINMHSINVVFLLAFPLVLNWIFLSVDSSLCCFSMGSPCLYANMVFIGGGDAYTLLWHFCFGHEAQTPFVKEMVSSLLSVCRMMLNRDFMP